MKNQRERFGNCAKIQLFKFNFELLTKYRFTPCRKTRYTHQCNFPWAGNRGKACRFF